LPQHRVDLPAMIDAMIDHVLKHLPQRIRLIVNEKVPVLDRALDRFGTALALLATPRLSSRTAEVIASNGIPPHLSLPGRSIHASVLLHDREVRGSIENQPVNQIP
jgi:hypothetical protein